MKCIWIMFVLFGITQSLKAQIKVFEEDVLYLHNGSIVRGEITEQEIGSQVIIRLRDGSSLTIKTSEIEKITREAPKFTKVKLKYSQLVMPGKYHKKGDIYTQITYGWAVNATTTEVIHDFSTHFKGLYYLARPLSVGLGSGFDTYESGLVVPIYAEVQGDLMKSKVTPYYFVQGGYGIGAYGTRNHQRFEGGFMGHAGLGLHVYTATNRSVLFSVGFRMQRTYQEFRDFPEIRTCCFPTTQNPDPPLVVGTRRYQKIVWQFTYSF